MILVIVLWLLPGWLVWRLASDPELQRGMLDWQIAILSWYPLIAVLMMFFAAVLYRRLPDTWTELTVYLVAVLVLPWLHWWLSGVGSLEMLVAEYATFSLTLIVFGFSAELLRRILKAAVGGEWLLVILGGLANLVVFVAPGVLIVISLYTMLFLQGLFRGGLVLQIPYVLGLVMAVYSDWRSFRHI